jgi:hypothetical protein
MSIPTIFPPLTVMAPAENRTPSRGRDRAGNAVDERRLGARSMFNETRATTVVSQPPRFSASRASVRLSRSQGSWTASSASLGEPSIR